LLFDLLDGLAYDPEPLGAVAEQVDYACLKLVILSVKKKHFTNDLIIDNILSCVKLFGGAYLKWQ
jgi:hypothetical protein